MKFAILTDIHLGPNASYKGVLRKLNKDVKVFLKEFIDEMNDNVKPSFVIVLGDLIEDDNETKDKNNIKYIVETLKKIECPVHYVAWNHDVINISEDDLVELFNQENLYYSFDKWDYHFITLFSKVSEDRTIWITEEQKEWLKNDLDATNKKCIVFVHHSLADQNLIGNPWFENRPENCLIANRTEIRSILSSSEKIISVFNGHLHWNKHDIHDNIPYFTVQSLTENEDDKWIASEAYWIVEIIEDKIDVEIKGNYPKKISY